MHESLRVILSPLKHFMKRPDVVKCPDGHFRRAIYMLGPYIADYPEQVLLATVVSGWCTRYESFHMQESFILKLVLSSCTSPTNDLDQRDPLLRTPVHTNACKDAFDSKKLWETYGIVSGVTVGHVSFSSMSASFTSSASHLRNIFPMQIFMS